MNARGHVRTHKDLDAWRSAIDRGAGVYEQSKGFPATERHGLSAQMRRAPTSVASNIAEGAARGSTADFRRFLCIARGSLAELQTQIAICDRIGLQVDAALMQRANVLGRMLNALIRSLDRARKDRQRPSG